MDIDPILPAKRLGDDSYPIVGLAFGPMTDVTLVKMGLVDYLKRDGPKSLG